MSTLQKGIYPTVGDLGVAVGGSMPGLDADSIYHWHGRAQGEARRSVSCIDGFYNDGKRERPDGRDSMTVADSILPPMISGMSPQAVGSPADGHSSNNVSRGRTHRRL